MRVPGNWAGNPDLRMIHILLLDYDGTTTAFSIQIAD
jgi:hypothetical protein